MQGHRMTVGGDHVIFALRGQRRLGLPVGHLLAAVFALGGLVRVNDEQPVCPVEDHAIARCAHAGSRRACRRLPESPSNAP